MAKPAAVLKLTVFVLWCVVLTPPQLLVMLFGKGRALYSVPHLWHRMICKTLRIEVIISGQPVDKHALYVSNHVSYLDIPVISSILPVSFVAKKDVETWPLFGFLAKLQQTVFIDRSRQATQEGKKQIQDRLNSGGSLIMFPEGTSSDGSEVLPFKSSLFSVMTDMDVQTIIQPFTIELFHVNGKPVLTSEERDLYAWHGDMTLMPHLWNFAQTKGAKVKLHFHPPIQVKETDNRKELAKICYESVASCLNKEQAVAA